jgi:hypothetical protein
VVRDAEIYGGAAALETQPLPRTRL